MPPAHITSDTAPEIDGRSFAAAQAFILTAKLYWTREIFPALKRDYEARAAAAENPPETATDAADLIGGTTLYQVYAWLERHLQRFKYSGRYGLQPYHAQQRVALEASLDPADLPPGLLDLDPGFNQPAYYTAVDIHQHPGGVWSDEIAGFVYERGARTTTPLLGRNHKDLHGRFTQLVDETGPRPRRLLDMGCGFGKSTQPFCESFEEAEVVGIDLSGPCLKLAARDAARADNERGARNVTFRQMDAARTDFEDGSFDLVTSTMLLHEMPPPALEVLFEEAHRVLAPGGRMVHLDFYHLPDAFARFIHCGHGRRNNEPYMQPLADMDVKATLEDKGFRNVEIRPFEEADGVLDASYGKWRFPWTVIMAER